MFVKEIAKITGSKSRAHQMAPGKEVIGNVSAKKNVEAYGDGRLHLWSLRVRMRSVFPPLLFIGGGTGRPGNLPGPAEEGTGGSGGTY